MTILDRVRGSLNIGPTVKASPEAIAAKLVEAEEARRRLNLRLGSAVLDDTGGQAAEIGEAIEEANRTVAALEAAHAEAVKREAVAAKVRAENEFTAKRAETEKHMAKAMAAYKAAAKNVAKAVADYEAGWEAFWLAWEGALAAGVDPNEAGLNGIRVGVKQLLGEVAFDLATGREYLPGATAHPFRNTSPTDYVAFLDNAEAALRTKFDEKLGDIRAP